MKYKVGDRVRVRRDLEAGKSYKNEGDHFSHCFATPSMVKFAGEVVTLRASKFKSRYAVDGCACFWTDEMFEGLAEDSHKIVITTDGKETLARLYDGKKVIKSASAKCSPSDKFDFNTGVKIAVERLVGEEKPKMYNGKVVCTASEYRFWTVGKVYEFEDGTIRDNDGDGRFGYKSFEDFKKRYIDSPVVRANFIPLAD